MTNSSKFTEELKNNDNYEQIFKHIQLHALDLLEENYCKEIFSAKITNFNDENIKDFIVKYKNIDDNIVTRKIKIQKNYIKTKISKGVLDRQNIKPFGKALDGNNQPTLDKLISISKPIQIKKANIQTIIKENKNLKVKPEKYVPPKSSNLSKPIKFNKYIPPSRKEGFSMPKLPQFKIKITNIGYDFTEEDIGNLCSNYGEVLNVYIPTFRGGKNDGKNKGFALVKFKNLNDMNNCLQNVNEMRYEGMILKANKC